MAKTVLPAVVLALAAPSFARTRMADVFPVYAASSANIPLPEGVKLIARLPLDGLPVSRMYTQWEYGRTYLYIEHGRQPLTAVDVTKKQSPMVVTHEPGKVESRRYAQLFEGGSVVVSPLWHVNTGIDNLGGQGTLIILENGNSDNAKLLAAVGPGYANLADRDHRPVFVASPAQLLVVQDNRVTAIDFINN